MKKSNKTLGALAGLAAIGGAVFAACKFLNKGHNDYEFEDFLPGECGCDDDCDCDVSCECGCKVEELMPTEEECCADACDCNDDCSCDDSCHCDCVDGI